MIVSAQKLPPDHDLPINIPFYLILKLQKIWNEKLLVDVYAMEDKDKRLLKQEAYAIFKEEIRQDQILIGNYYFTEKVELT
jgi:hypothetical protein